MVGLPLDGAELGRGFLILGAAGHERDEKERKERLHVVGDGTNGRGCLFHGKVLYCGCLGETASLLDGSRRVRGSV